MVGLKKRTTKIDDGGKARVLNYLTILGKVKYGKEMKNSHVGGAKEGGTRKRKRKTFTRKLNNQRINFKKKCPNSKKGSRRGER